MRIFFPFAPIIIIVAIVLYGNLLSAHPMINVTPANNFSNFGARNHDEDNDSVATVDRGQVGVNLKIAIPVSILAGAVSARIFGYLNKEDVEGPGPEAYMEIVVFAAGFTCSMAIFYLIAYSKTKEQKEKNRTSSLDLSIINNQVMINSRIYFLNYKYHF